MTTKRVRVKNVVHGTVSELEISSSTVPTDVLATVNCPPNDRYALYANCHGQPLESDALVSEHVSEGGTLYVCPIPTF